MIKIKDISHIFFTLPLVRRMQIIAFGIVALLVPIAFSFGVKNPFVAPKLFLFGIGLFLISVFVFIEFFKKKITLTLSEILLFVYIFLLFISTIFSVSQGVSIEGNFGKFLGFNTLTALSLLAILSAKLLDRSYMIRVVVSLLCVGSFVVVVFGLLQHYGFALNNLSLSAEGSRAFSSIGHANHLGGFLVQHFFLFLGLSLALSLKPWKIILISFLNLWLLLETASRGALATFLLLSFFAFIALFFYWKKVEPVAYRRRLKIGAILVLILVVLGAVFWKSISKLSVIDRTKQTIEFFAQGNLPDRFSWALSSVEMIKEKPLFGFGVSSFQGVYSLYRRTDYRAPGDEQDLILPEAAHNEFLNMAVTQGVVATGVFLFLIFNVFAKVRRIFLKKYSVNPREAFEIMFYLFAFVSFYIQTIISFGVIGTMVPTFLILGVLFAMIYEEEYKIEMNSVKKFAIIIFAVIFSIYFLVYSTNVLMASRNVRIAEYAAADATIQGDPSIYFLQKSISFLPKSSYLFYILGEKYHTQALRYIEDDGTVLRSNYEVLEANFKLANEAYLRGYALDPYYFLFAYNLGELHLFYSGFLTSKGLDAASIQSEQDAIKWYNIVLETAKNNPLYIVEIAKRMELLGYNDRATELYQKAREIRPNYPGLPTNNQSLMPGL